MPRCPRSERYAWRLRTELSANQPAVEAVPLLESVIAQARERQIWSHEGPARVRLIEALLRAEQASAAADQASALSVELETKPMQMLYAGEYHWALARAFDAAGDTAARDALLRHALAGIADLAQRHVPDAFRDSFLNRNPFNRQLRGMAARHGVQANIQG